MAVRADRPRTYAERLRLVLREAEVDALKNAMRRQQHTPIENERKSLSGWGHLQRPSGWAAKYVTDWEAGIGIYPKMLWDRLVLAGFRHLLPAEEADFRKMLNGDPHRPWSPELLRVTVTLLGFDYDVFLGYVPPRPSHLDALLAEAESLVRVPVDDAEMADVARRELDAQMRALAELFARERSELLGNPSIGVDAIAAVRKKLPELKRIFLTATVAGRDRQARSRVADEATNRADPPRANSHQKGSPSTGTTLASSIRPRAEQSR
jgi:hypothetical protein